jgi:hypothetical protein
MLPPGYGAVPPQYPTPVQHPVPGPGPKKHLGLIVGIVAAVVLVAIAGVVVYTRLAADTPRGAVNAWFDAVKDRNVNDLRALTCAQYAAEIEATDFDDEEVTSVTWNITAVNEIDDNSAIATIDLTYMDSGETERETVRFSVVKENGDWKVCGPADE